MTGSELRQKRGIAIDLGTTRTRLARPGRGIVVDEPTACAFCAEEKRFSAFGREVFEEELQRRATVCTVFPVQEGALLDCVAAEAMLRNYYKKAMQGSLVKRTRAVVALPGGGSEVARRTVEHIVALSGALRVRLVDSLFAAAVGAGVNVRSGSATAVVHVGAGRAEAAILACGGILAREMCFAGGDAMDRAIRDYLERRRGLTVGRAAAERVKVALGDSEQSEGNVFRIHGRDLDSQMPAAMGITMEEIQEALEPCVAAIVTAVKTVMEQAPADSVGDLLHSGMVLTGGGARLFGLRERLFKEIGLSVVVADEPELCVVRGLCALLDEAYALRSGSEMNFLAPFSSPSSSEEQAAG